MNNEIAPTRDALDDKANRLFAGKVVRKDLVRKVKVGANVPVFVLEFLLGKYCASSGDSCSIAFAMRPAAICASSPMTGGRSSQRRWGPTPVLLAPRSGVQHRSRFLCDGSARRRTPGVTDVRV